MNTTQTKTINFFIYIKRLPSTQAKQMKWVSTLSDACIISKKIVRQENKQLKKTILLLHRGEGCYLFLQYYSGFASRYDSLLIVISPKTSVKIAKSSSASTNSIKHFILFRYNFHSFCPINRQNCMERLFLHIYNKNASFWPI